MTGLPPAVVALLDEREDRKTEPKHTEQSAGIVDGHPCLAPVFCFQHGKEVL
jgi:hypothetical protein